MRLSNREEFMLWRLIEFNLHRYLLRIVRKQGAEKAEQHLEFSKTLWEVAHARTALPEHHREWMRLHDLIADKVTNHLPRVIGFDLDDDQQDWDLLADRLFRALLKILPQPNPAQSARPKRGLRQAPKGSRTPHRQKARLTLAIKNEID